VTPIPLWVEQAIDSFVRTSTSTTQTEEGEMNDLSSRAPSTDEFAVECCRICNKERIDEHAVVRVLDLDQVCQLCRPALE
jgi:hypothetical protein